MNGNTAYITRSSVCLPNAPVENDRVEAILGQVGDRPSRARRVVQRSNGIRQRYYVIDPATGEPNFTNASLTAAAVKDTARHGMNSSPFLSHGSPRLQSGGGSGPPLVELLSGFQPTVRRHSSGSPG